MKEKRCSLYHTLPYEAGKSGVGYVYLGSGGGLEIWNMGFLNQLCWLVFSLLVVSCIYVSSCSVLMSLDLVFLASIVQFYVYGLSVCVYV